MKRHIIPTKRYWQHMEEYCDEECASLVYSSTCDMKTKTRQEKRVMNKWDCYEQDEVVEAT